MAMKWVLHIPPSSSITDCLVSYPGHLFGESYPSAEMQSVYSRAPIDGAKIDLMSQELGKYILQSKWLWTNYSWRMVIWSYNCAQRIKYESLVEKIKLKYLTLILNDPTRVIFHAVKLTTQCDHNQEIKPLMSNLIFFCYFSFHIIACKLLVLDRNTWNSRRHT